VYYGVIGQPMEIAITDILEIGQLVKSRAFRDEQGVESSPYGDGQIGVVVEIKEVHDAQIGHVVKILWQGTGEVEGMPDWFAVELLDPIPS